MVASAGCKRPARRAKLAACCLLLAACCLLLAACCLLPILAILATNTACTGRKTSGNTAYSSQTGATPDHHNNCKTDQQNSEAKKKRRLDSAAFF
jgi:hypothetical protein